MMLAGPQGPPSSSTAQGVVKEVSTAVPSRSNEFWAKLAWEVASTTLQATPTAWESTWLLEKERVAPGAKRLTLTAAEGEGSQAVKRLSETTTLPQEPQVTEDSNAHPSTARDPPDERVSG